MAAIAWAGLLAGCAAEPPPSPPEPASPAVWIESRDTTVPIEFVAPSAGFAAPAPFVVMAHGHGGDRNESGAFSRLAEALAARGIASVRVDFPGCGESREPFTANNLTAILADLAAARAYAEAQPGVDAARAAIVGYSMGARAAMLALDADPGYAAAALWAPAGGDGPASMYFFLGGPQSYEAYRETARRDGSADILTPWGQRQSLGAQWFEDMDALRPMPAVAAFGGPLFVLHGDDDPIVDASVAAAVAEAAIRSPDVRYELLPEAGHGLGFYDAEPELAASVIQGTVEFLVDALGPTQRTRPQPDVMYNPATAQAAPGPGRLRKTKP